MKKFQHHYYNSLLKEADSNGGMYRGSVNLMRIHLKELPEFLKDIIIYGSFYCSSNQLTSLKHCPKEVGRGFYCSNNNLTSLEHCPIKVGEDFYCLDNKLTSLEHCPIKVDGDFSCYNNAVEFSEEYVRSICNTNGKVFV